jgi:phosphonate transport system permease protein
MTWRTGRPGRDVSAIARSAKVEAPRREYSLTRYRPYVGRTVVLSALTLFAAWWCEVNVADLAKGLGKGLAMLGEFVPPDWESFPRMIEPALVTVLVAATATPLGAFCAIVFGMAAARNISPPWLRTPTRALIALERGLPEIVVLLILVAALGIGPFAGVVALVLGSIGMLGKLVGDAIEEIDERTVESVACVGATKAQMIRYAVIPQVLPSLLANSMFRFEVNIRASVLLGAVGAGGIGYELSTAMTQVDYSRATTAAIVSFVLVLAAERVSDALRSRILSHGALA